MRFAVLAFSLSAIASAADIPQGSHLLLRLENNITTRTAREGDYVYCRTASPIAVNGQILVPEGSYAQGVVTHTVRSGRVKGKAELSIRIENLTLPSGKVIKLSPRLKSVDSEGSEQKSRLQRERDQTGIKPRRRCSSPDRPNGRCGRSDRRAGYTLMVGSWDRSRCRWRSRTGDGFADARQRGGSASRLDHGCGLRSCRAGGVKKERPPRRVTEEDGR